ncbi:MAG: hypothetical protein GF411_01020 [Candidatus Lokiarchaeota archaeon]|nr:hypothetical protein [Candidatus Lokiarchaeota archaeon]
MANESWSSNAKMNIDHNTKIMLQNSQLREAQGKSGDDLINAFGTGYFVDRDGQLYNIGKAKTHEEWANQRDTTTNDLLDRGWTRIRNFGAFDYIQGDSRTLDNIWYLIEIADKVNKNRIIYTYDRNRIELIKHDDDKWRAINGKEIKDIIECKIIPESFTSKIY